MPELVTEMDLKVLAVDRVQAELDACEMDMEELDKTRAVAMAEESKRVTYLAAQREGLALTQVRIHERSEKLAHIKHAVSTTKLAQARLDASLAIAQAVTRAGIALSNAAELGVDCSDFERTSRIIVFKKQGAGAGARSLDTLESGTGAEAGLRFRGRVDREAKVHSPGLQGRSDGRHPVAGRQR